MTLVARAYPDPQFIDADGRVRADAVAIRTTQGDILAGELLGYVLSYLDRIDQVSIEQLRSRLLTETAKWRGQDAPKAVSYLRDQGLATTEPKKIERRTNVWLTYRGDVARRSQGGLAPTPWGPRESMCGKSGVSVVACRMCWPDDAIALSTVLGSDGERGDRLATDHTSDRPARPDLCLILVLDVSVLGVVTAFCWCPAVRVVRTLVTWAATSIGRGVDERRTARFTADAASHSGSCATRRAPLLLPHLRPPLCCLSSPRHHR